MAVTIEKDRNVSHTELLKIIKANFILSIVISIIVSLIAVELIILFRQGRNRQSSDEPSLKSEDIPKKYSSRTSPDKTEVRDQDRIRRNDKPYKTHAESDDPDKFSREAGNKKFHPEYKKSTSPGGYNKISDFPKNEKPPDSSAETGINPSEGYVSQRYSGYALKLGFIYNFAKFTKWPQSAFEHEDDPIILCLTQRNLAIQPFEKIENKTIGQRSFLIDYFDEDTDIDHIHIIFDNSRNADIAKQILNLCKSKPILTVGETEGFAHLGGLINFYTENNRIRYELNIDAARQSGLKFYSQILISGKIIRESQPDP